ncbi:hypothetical protein MXB_916 [Myxobolus squamalis]|nr:hypothetical protein MXB_916 [Myxobolus squamalis]
MMPRVCVVDFEMVLLKVDVIFTFDRLFLEKYKSPEFLQLSSTLACSVLVCFWLFLDKLEIGVLVTQMAFFGIILREHGLHDLSLNCGIFMLFPSTIFGGEQITIWNDIIVTSMNSLRIPIQTCLL